MSTSNEPKRATDLMSTTRAGACSPPHRQSSFSKFIEALRLDEEIGDDDEEEENDYNDGANALHAPSSAGTSCAVATKASTPTFSLRDRYNRHQHRSTCINIKAPSARDILLRSITGTDHHSDGDVDIQDTASMVLSTGKGRHFLHADNLSKFIEKTHSDLGKEEHEINAAAITAICSAGVKDPVSAKTSMRQDSFHDALVDIILTEQAKVGDNKKKKCCRKSTTKANIASDLRRRISDEIDWKPKRLSANMA